jgi:hypothetical protein
MKTAIRVPALTAALLVLASPVRLRAQATEAAATALFDDGRKLMTQHRYPEACPKLAESQRLAPSGGTLLNLADCYEHTGQTASAWVAWKDAAARADAAGKADVENKALARAAALEPGLAKLAIAVAPGSGVSGLEIKRDGVAVGPAEYGLPIPVDPGRHLIEAAAPKKKEWSAIIEVLPKQSDARVTVTLADEVEAGPPAVPAPPPAPLGNAPEPTHAASASATDRPATGAGSTQRTLGFVALGVGVAGVAVGSAFGLVAMSKNNEALGPQNCRTSTLCNQTGLSLTSDAKNDATLSTIAFGVGAAGLVAGAVLWLTAPKTPVPAAGAVRVAPEVGRSYGGVSVGGAW